MSRSTNKWREDTEQDFLQALRRSSAPLLDPYHSAAFLDGHLRTANFVLSPNKGRSHDADRSYQDNEGFWNDILNRRLRANTTVRLVDFKLTEWVPRAPGVFHTQDGREAREMARHFVLPDTTYMPLVQSLGNQNEIDPAELETLKIFDPRGKGSMIYGGVGCIRTTSWSQQTRNGTEDWWLLGATSSAVVHEGLPVRLSDPQYQRRIGDIVAGGLNCSLIGKVRFVPDDLVALYAHGIGIPKVYIEVDSIQPVLPSAARHSDRCLVSAAIAFQSDYPILFIA